MAQVAVVGADTAITITDPQVALGECRTSLYCYSPQAAEGLTGAPVRWTNPTNIAHSATGDGFDVLLAAGQSGAWTFTSPGTYAYRCRFWPVMTGTLVITAARSPMAAPAPATTAPPHPPDATPAPPINSASPVPVPSTPVAQGGVATIFLPATSPAAGAQPPVSTPLPTVHSPAPLGSTTTSSRRPATLYVIGVLLFAAVAGGALVRRGLGWWRRVSADPLADDTLARIA